MKDITLPIYLNNFQIFDLDTSSTEKRYRVVSETCDIEINEKVKDLLDFIKSNEGKTSSFVLERYNSNKESVEKTLSLLFKKGVLSNEKMEPKVIKEENYFRNKMEHLWFRIRLIDTDKYLGFFKFFSFVFTKSFVYPALTLFFIFDIVFVLLYFFTPWGKQLIYFSVLDYLWLGVLSYIMIWFHEMGHIVAASKYGAKTGGIGIGIYYYLFVAYADVHETWNLPRYQRKVVSIAGFYWNIIFMLPIYLLCFLTHSKAIADFILLFHFAFISVFNPFLKMDGYWFLCDILGVPNLQTRIKSYFYQYLPAKLFKSNPVNPFISYPENIKRGIRIYLLFFILFMVIFMSLFLYRAIGITMNMEAEIFNPVKYIIANWRQGLSGLTSHINILLRNSFILFGVIMLSLSYFVKMIKYIISKLKR